MLVLLVVVLGAVAAAVYQSWFKPAPVSQPIVVEVPTAPVTVGPLERTMRVGGVTSSIDYINIRAPEPRGPEQGTLILMELAESGTKVPAKAVLARIDGQSAKDHIEDVITIVEASVADIKKRHAEHQIDRENLVQDVALSQAEMDKWKLEAGASEIRTVIDREIIQLAVEEAEAAYNEKRKELGLKDQVQQAEIRILEFTTQRHRRHLRRHTNDLQQFVVYSPMAGMAVRQMIWRGAEMNLVQVGDQLFPGRLFLKVMDTSQMQIEGEINQAESENFRIGQTATVGLDAFPGRTYKGRIASIGALAKAGGFQSGFVRKIPVRILIENSDDRVIPDLSAHADVVVTRTENATQIPRAAVFSEAGKPIVYVKKGEKYERRSVELGLRSNIDIAVLSGLSAGETVALQKPPSAN